MLLARSWACVGDENVPFCVEIRQETKSNRFQDGPGKTKNTSLYRKLCMCAVHILKDLMLDELTMWFSPVL